MNDWETMRQERQFEQTVQSRRRLSRRLYLTAVGCFGFAVESEFTGKPALVTPMLLIGGLAMLSGAVTNNVADIYQTKLEQLTAQPPTLTQGGDENNEG